MAPLTCCDGYECQQIIGGKKCASNRQETTTALPLAAEAEETTTALPPSEDVNQNNNRGSNYDGPIANTDIEQCKRLCAMSGSTKCTGWTVTNNNECYLKTGVEDMQYDTGVQGRG